MTVEKLRIGQVADAAGVNIQTLRYYERRGLVRPISRRACGYREYDASGVGLVRFIKRAQELGFALAEIQELLALRDSSSARCTDVRRKTREKIEDIDRRIQSFTAMKRALIALIQSCPSSGPIHYCPILESLAAGNSKRKGNAK